MNTDEISSKKRTTKISSIKKENTILSNHNNNLFLNLSVNKNKKREPLNNNYLVSYRNHNLKRKNFLNEIDYYSRPLNILSTKNYNTNSNINNNNTITINNKYHNFRERKNVEHNNNNNIALISQSDIDKNNLDEITKLSNVND